MKNKTILLLTGMLLMEIIPTSEDPKDNTYNEVYTFNDVILN